ncbi:MAG: hypothetical protein DRJ08_03700 [Acidobacteria bacterium]|nr:MAG: hypothetical protein DRJ14_00245 [Acidobacteriota bacterium]RLE22717.1 MAG: hypothetical protein DRJ08_03700 [Acidobacteriota bacterium]
MPQGDQTGPEGKGPRTGRGLGKSAGNDRPGSEQPGPGRLGGNRGQGRGAGIGRGQGRGSGRGMGRGGGRGR